MTERLCSYNMILNITFYNEVIIVTFVLVEMVSMSVVEYMTMLIEMR